ncbi:helix-turn-helix transcriptional regulator [Lentzea cavernae]|uniref:LuxR family transcriptional regulator n=1 Tax=Lentzea cavernae TaxID=2020703 RepID=A0ABQ3MSK2_9PSEU|nr:helix-turn-helix transcriptional regulator [Lentzea cavernae]GHH50974.1 LuxR family transcriptional regulator [Lentzea cavernae]
MPPVARLGSGIPLVARDRELDRLRAALAQAGEGTAGAVLLAGDAGVGKTRLIDELAASADDTLVLMGRCLDAGETGLPYLPFAEALGTLKSDVANRPALAMLLPQLALPAEREPGTEGMIAPSLIPGRRPEQDVGQLQLFDAVLGLLGDLSERQRVLLVVEDLHWADASTRYLLSFLLSRLRSQRLLVVGTYRADDLHRSHPLRPLLSELVRLPAVDRLDLTPFNAADARRFVEALSDDLPADVLQQVAERSEGNAFFAEELIAVATCDDARSLPSALADVLLSRVESLSPEAQHVIRVASVRGRRVRHFRLHEVSGMTDIAFDTALRELVQHHLFVVHDDEVYAFRHALVREAVYGDLLPGERVRLHAAYAHHLARHLDERGASAALAHHAFQSHDLPQALKASINASKEAERAGAPAESLRYLEKALNLWDAVAEADRPSDVDESVLLRRASWVAGTAGQPERAVAFARSATKAIRAGQTPEEAAEIWLRLSQALSVLDGNEEEHFLVLGKAFALVQDREPSPTRARAFAGKASSLRQQREDAAAREAAELAIADGQTANAPGAVADGLGTLAILDDHANRPDEAKNSFERAIECAREVGAFNNELRAWYYYGLMHYDRGELAESARVFNLAGDRAKETGLTWSTFGLEIRILQVLVHYYVGDWDYAAWASEPPGMSVSSTVLARLASASTHLTVSRGDLAESERMITKLRSDWHRDIQIALITGGTGAELALWRGRPELAVERVTDALEWARKLGGPWMLAGIRIGAIGIAAHAEIAAKARRKRDAEAEKNAVAAGHELAEHVRLTARNGKPRAGTLGPEGRAWLARANAEESRLHGAGDPVLWQAAVDEFGYGVAYEQALCRWRLAEALLGADRRDEAAEQLRPADEVATNLKAVPLAEAVASCAKRARITLRADEPVREQVDLFTPRERDVLGLVASGRTNREVGEELYISEKTVSVHLSRIMAKLGASRRAEAVAIAYDRGLLE